MKRFGPLLFVLALMSTVVMAQEEIHTCVTDELVVTGSSMPHHLSKAGQTITIISKEDIAAMPVSTIAELLETVNGVDIRQRGASGIQADVSIRGSSFEQTLILVDGFNMSDSQTGHHNMNLPVNLTDIERIEILKGPGARVYGHNAMAGVVNIITKDPERKRIGGEIQMGEYDFWGFSGNVSGKIKGLSNRLSLSRKSSSGYIPGEETDFDVQTMTYKGALKGTNHSVQVGMGYTENDFGAYKFYTDFYPDQREKTETFLVYGNGEFNLSKVEVSSKIFWRRNRDDFSIETGDNWSQNKHRTDAYGFQAGTHMATFLGETAFGVEMTKEVIESSNLGDHDRSRYGFFLEQKFYPTEPLSIGIGASAMRYTRWGWEFWPGADMNVKLAEGLNGFASIARSFRVPTYTELYYSTAANQGNPNLKPEEAWTGEVGIRRNKNGFGTQVSFFVRDADDVIDWIRQPGETVWQVRNMAETGTRGIELGVDLYPGILFDCLHQTAVQMNYTYLDTRWDTGDFESKYVLDHLRHQLNGVLWIEWLSNLNQSINLRYEERMNGNSHTVVDSRLAYRHEPFEFYLDVTNLTDESLY